MDHAILNQIRQPLCDLEWNNFVYESIIAMETVVPANYIALLEKILATKLDATDPIAITTNQYTGLTDIMKMVCNYVLISKVVHGCMKFKQKLYPMHLILIFLSTIRDKRSLMNIFSGILLSHPSNFKKVVIIHSCLLR
jgi:hypothetical protein